MSQRQWYVLAIGVALVGVGLFALRFPVYLDDFDQWGWQIKCGTGFAGDLAQAGAATNATHFIADCESALLVRRLWTVPLVVVGATGVIGVLLVSALSSVHQTSATAQSAQRRPAE